MKTATRAAMARGEALILGVVVAYVLVYAACVHYVTQTSVPGKVRHAIVLQTRHH